MNAKLAKALRKALRLNGVNPTQTTYEARNEHIVVGYSMTEMNDDGTKIVNCRTTAQTNYLAPACGRALYKAMKRVNA